MQMAKRQLMSACPNREQGHAHRSVQLTVLTRRPWYIMGLDPACTSSQRIIDSG